MTDPGTRIDPPLFMAHTTIGCPNCRADMPVLALVAPNVPAAGGEICVLSDIQELPDQIMESVHTRFPTFKQHRSKALGFRFYANTCPACGVMAPDFDLHCEPGGPFFPETREEAEALTLEPVPLRESIRVRANLGMGIGDLILDHARRADAPQAPGPEA